MISGAPKVDGMSDPDDDRLTLRQARARYFVANGFDESGYTDRWVKLMAGPVPIFFPNTAARVRAVRLHDLHHAITGYGTTWVGEAEIGAWEIASNCADHYAAWALNLVAMGIGLLLAPAAVWRAFLRGRHSQNFYRTEFRDALLERQLGSVRAELALDRDLPAAHPGDVTTFAGWATASMLALAMVVVTTLAIWLAVMVPLFLLVTAR